MELISPKEQYEEWGYTILRSLFKPEEMASIGGLVEGVYSQWTRENKAEIINNKLVNMHSLTLPEYFEGAPEKRAELFEALVSLKLTEAIEGIFGSGIYFHNTQLFFNPIDKGRLPYWHRDMQYSPIDDVIQRDEQLNMLSLHVRIPLVEEKGLEVVSGSHKRWDTELERNVRLELKGHKNSEALPAGVLIHLRPGDIVIFNAQMIHRGNYELNPVRKALDLCIGKYHPLALDFLDGRVLPEEGEMENIANNQWYKLAREVAASKLG